MDVIDTLEELRVDGGAVRCVLTDSLESDLAREAVEALSLRVAPGRPRPRRPRALVDADQLDLVLVVFGEDRESSLVEVLTTGHGLLVSAPPQGLEVIRTALAKASSHPAGAEDSWSIVVLIALAVARRCEAVLDGIDDECQELEARATGYTSAMRRRSMSRLRATLFHLQDTQAAQQAMLAPEEELAQFLDPTELILLKRAVTAFDANRATAARLYAMLGDLLGEQNTVVSERLTLVATIFMPLTLATGFFGMNFGWLTDHIGSAGSFLVLGLLVPTGLTVITLACVRRLTRSS